MNRMFKFAHRPALTVAGVAMLSTSLLLVASPASADARSHLTDPTPETDSKDAIPNRAVMMQMNIVSTDDDALAAAARKSSETIQRYPSATTDPHSAIIEIKDGTSPFAVRAGMASIDADIAEFWETADAARVVSSNSVYGSEAFLLSRTQRASRKHLLQGMEQNPEISVCGESAEEQGSTL